MRICRNEKCAARVLGHTRDAKFCWMCGTDLMETEKRQCECGMTLHDLDAFCTNCGKKVGK